MSGNLQFSGAALTDVGLRRSSNQDSYLYSEELGLFVVADGMGGHSGGETASRIAVETIDSFYRERAGDPPTHDPLEEVEILRKAVETANRAIFEHAQQHPELRGMGTTLVALRTVGQTGFAAHVGDSRLYRFDTISLRRVTKDHSRVQELIDAKQLTELEAQSILGRNIITRALGNRPFVEVDTQILDLRPDEAYLLCSDGLCGVLSDEETFRICTSVRPTDPQRIAEDLVAKVKENGAPDNVTVLLVMGSRFGEVRERRSELEQFDLYPDTQKILGEDGAEDAQEQTQPILLGRAEAAELAARTAAAAAAAASAGDSASGTDPAEAVLNRGPAESMAQLESLVQNVASSRNASSGTADSGTPGVAALPGDDQESTLRLSAGQIQQARAASLRPTSDAETMRLQRPASAPAAREPAIAPAAESAAGSGAANPAAEPRHELVVPPRAGRSRLLAAGLLVVLIALVFGYVAFGPARSRHLLVDYQPSSKHVEVRQVGVPFGADLGRSLLGGPLGGLLLALRSPEHSVLPLPEEVPEAVWSQLADCPSCAALASGDRVVETSDASIQDFATRLYGSLGDHYRDQRDYEKARSFHRAAEQHADAADARLRLARDHYIEGTELQGNRNHAAALTNYRRARELGGVEPDLTERLATVAFEEGKRLAENGQKAQADQMLRLAEDSGYPKSEIDRLRERAGIPAGAAPGTHPGETAPPPKLEAAPPPLLDPLPDVPAEDDEASGEDGQTLPDGDDDDEAGGAGAATDAGPVPAKETIADPFRDDQPIVTRPPGTPAAARTPQKRSAATPVVEYLIPPVTTPTMPPSRERRPREP